MKLILIITVVYSLSIFAQNEKRTVTIDKNNQGGFNIYNSKGELVTEYSKRNTDSLSLETLNNIFFKADSKNTLVVPIINLQEKRFDWTTIIIAFLGLVGTFSAGFYTNKLNSKSQVNQFLLQQRIERKKEWLNDFSNNASILQAKLVRLNQILFRYIHNRNSTDEIEKAMFENARKSLIEVNENITEDINNAMNNFTFLLGSLDEEDLKEKLKNLLNLITDKLNKHELINDDVRLLKSICHGIVFEKEKTLLD
jgi:hypothetical protein